MDYKIIENNRVKLTFNLHENHYTLICNTLNNDGDAVVLGKFRQPYNNEALSFIKPGQPLKYFIEDFERVLTFLNNEPELQLQNFQSALDNICLNHIKKFRRLIDSDLSSYGDIVLMFYEIINPNLIFNEGIKVRSKLIMEILNNYPDIIYIYTTLFGKFHEPELILYSKCRKIRDIGFQLRIIPNFPIEDKSPGFFQRLFSGW